MSDRNRKHQNIRSKFPQFPGSNQTEQFLQTTTKTYSTSSKRITVVIILITLLNQVIQAGSDNNRTTSLNTANQVPPLISLAPLIPICNQNNRIILEPFIESGLKEANYSNVCDIPFVRLRRSNSVGKEVLLMLMQITLSDGRFKNLHKVINYHIEDIYIVHKIVGKPGHYQLLTNRRRAPFYFKIDDNYSNRYGNQNKTQNGTENHHEIILKQNRLYNLNDTFHFEIRKLNHKYQKYNDNRQRCSYSENKNDTSPICKPVDTSQSFTVTCISIDPNSHCYPSIHIYSIVCHCDMIRERSHAAGISDRTGVILPCLCILFLLIIVYSFAMRSKIVRNPTTPEEQLNLIMCTVATAIYEYNLTFRVGCATGDFDYDTTYVDFEILGPNDGVVGSPVRFDLGLLPDLVCGEMNCLIGRITPMPPIHGIRAVHSDDRNFLFFYEWVLRDLRDSTVIERRVISRYIEGRPVVFRGVESSSHDNEDSGLYPELPIEELSYVETLTLLSLSVMMMACFTMLFENFDVVYFASKHDNGSLYRSLQDVIFVTPIGTVSLMFCIFVYKYYLKRIQLRYEFSLDKFEAYFWFKVCDSFLIFLVKICIVCAVICVYFGLQISFTLSAYWYSSVLLCSVVVHGLWSIFNRCVCIKNFYESSRIFGRGPTIPIVPPPPVYRPPRRRPRPRAQH